LIAVHLLIATGSAAHKMPIPGAELPGCVTSDEILQQNWVPPRLAVIGAGAVGLELAYLFAQLGSQVTLLEAGPHVLPEEEQEIGFEVERHLLSSQCQVLANARALRVIRQGAMLNLAYSHQGVERTLEADEVLFATPRRPRLGDLALENAGIGVEDGCVVVDGECETNVSGVYAIGDCIRGNGWAQQAVAEGIHVAELINDQMPNIDLQHTPRCYHTFPPVAVIGLGPRGAAARGWEVKTGRVEFSLNERAVTAGQETGWVQIVADASTDKILGGQIVGACASELINQIAPALKMHQTLSEFLDGACSFPAFSNLWREAARRAR
jgi:dihydrolipoamide dehydrogenase